MSGRRRETPGAIEIRDARPDDFPVMSSVYRRASLANERDRDNLLADPAHLELSDAAARPGRSLVAVIDGRVIGFASIDPVEHALELDALFVDPDWMRHRAGTALVAAVAERARDLGLSTVTVSANFHALAFYRHAGFIETGLVELEFGPAPRLVLYVSLAGVERPDLPT